MGDSGSRRVKLRLPSLEYRLPIAQAHNANRTRSAMFGLSLDI